MSHDVWRTIALLFCAAMALVSVVLGVWISALVFVGVGCVVAFSH